jgi:hypothetical protein
MSLTSSLLPYEKQNKDALTARHAKIASAATWWGESRAEFDLRLSWMLDYVLGLCLRPD